MTFTDLQTCHLVKLRRDFSDRVIDFFFVVVVVGGVESGKSLDRGSLNFVGSNSVLLLFVLLFIECLK